MPQPDPNEPLRETIDALQQQVERHSQSIARLTELLVHESAGAGHALSLAAEPRVSIIMPVWNRADRVDASIASVLRQTYLNWELLVIDDGSSDGTAARLEKWRSEPRMRVFHQPHAGCAAARNRGLAESRGDIIAYLDSDNTWYPRYLEEVVAALTANPRLQSVYLCQLVQDHRQRATFVRGEPFDLEQLLQENFIDLNVFAHRREAVLRLGGFDASLRRLVDWDLILRLAAESPPQRVLALGGAYEAGGWPRVENSESHHLARYQIRRKWERPLTSPPRVLYILHSYPQLSETYVRSEIEYMRRRGVHIEVWSWHHPMRPYPTDLPIHRGSLAEAVARSRPDLLHVHWLSIGQEALALAEPIGLPVTFRGHGYEFSSARGTELLRHPAVRRLYIFPHFVAQLPASEKVMPLPVAFSPDRHYPPARKDPRLVVRVSLAKPTKDPATFLETARLCPEHRFVLAVCTPTGREGAANEVRALAASLKSPAEIQVDVSNEAAAELVRAAGIFMHTYSYEEPFGMPISIAEALATGAHVLARDGAHIHGYLGSCGQLYQNAEHAAALIAETLKWSPERWQAVQLAAIDRAYSCFADSNVLDRMLDDWQAIVAKKACSRAA